MICIFLRKIVDMFTKITRDILSDDVLSDIDNRTISTVTGLQSALDGKASLSGNNVFTGSVTLPTGFLVTAASGLEGGEITIQKATGQGLVSNLSIDTYDESFRIFDSGLPSRMMNYDLVSGDLTLNGNLVFHDNRLPTKSQVGLSNVDNTSDANKPVSTATQTALALKASITTLAGDDGSVGIGFKGPLADEIRRSAYLNFIEVKRVQRWGVEPGNSAINNRQALQKAINSTTKAEFVFADGDTLIDDVVTVPTGSILYFAGQGCGVSRILQTNMTKDGIRFDMGYAQGGGIRGLTVGSNVAGGARGSSGVGLRVINANDQFMARDFEIMNFDKCIRVDGSFQPSFKDFRLLYFSNYGIFLSPYVGAGTDTAGTRWSNGKISNYGYTGPNPELSDGILIHQGSGEFFDTVDVTQVGIPVHIAPPSGSFARFLKFKTVLADTAYYESWMVDGSDAPTFNIRMLDCWASGAGGGALRPSGSARGAGLVTKGNQLDDLAWIGGEIRDNDCGGWRHEGGINVRVMESSILRNSRRIGFDNVYPGVNISPNVSSWSLINNRIGNFSQGVFNVNQAEAIVIESGASDNFIVTGNNLHNPGPGKSCIVNGSTSSNWIINNNLPNQTSGVNYNRSAVYTGCSIGTVAANATCYLSTNGQQSQEADAYILISDPGILRQFIVQVDTAAGTAQSFEYMIRINGQNTTMTGTISGSGVFQLILQSSLIVNVGDIVTIRLITSPTATPARHRWSLNKDA